MAPRKARPNTRRRLASKAKTKPQAITWPGQITIAGVTRELSALIDLETLFGDKGRIPEEIRGAEDVVRERKEDLEGVVASLEPRSVDDCALMAFLLLNELDTYHSRYEIEGREASAMRRRIERLGQGLARGLIDASNLPPRMVEWYFGAHRRKWMEQEYHYLETLKALPDSDLADLAAGENERPASEAA